MPKYVIKIGNKGVTVKSGSETRKMRTFKLIGKSSSALWPWLKTLVTGMVTKLIYSTHSIPAVDPKVLAAAVLIWWLVEVGQKYAYKTVAKLQYKYLEKYKSFRTGSSSFRIEGNGQTFRVKYKSVKDFKVFDVNGKLLYDTRHQKFRTEELFTKRKWKVLKKAVLEIQFEPSSRVPDDVLVLSALTNYLLKQVRAIQVKLIMKLVLGTALPLSALVVTSIREIQKRIQKKGGN